MPLSDRMKMWLRREGFKSLRSGKVPDTEGQVGECTQVGQAHAACMHTHVHTCTHTSGSDGLARKELTRQAVLQKKLILFQSMFKTYIIIYNI